MFFLAGCDGLQSSLAPKTEAAQSIFQLSSVLFIGAAVIFSAVLLLMAMAMFSSPHNRRWVASRTVIILGGAISPAILLTALLIYSLRLSAGLGSHIGQGPLRIEVIGEQFWWRVRYTGTDGQESFETANEIRIPIGRTIELNLTSRDVIHSFWVPNLGGKLDMLPGQVNSLQLRADEPGIYRGQCAEFCGAQHAQMALYAVVHTAEDFDHWLAGQRRPAVGSTIPRIEQGKALFVGAGCGACHTIRGTAAAGTLGPDLTHIGSRYSIGAGILPNNIGTLAAWIASAQHLKPGNKMPSFNIFKGTELRSLALYLESLK
jgi:cytochrome c oxidase subunit 2